MHVSCKRSNSTRNELFNTNDKLVALFALKIVDIIFVQIYNNKNFIVLSNDYCMQYLYSDIVALTSEINKLSNKYTHLKK